MNSPPCGGEQIQLQQHQPHDSHPGWTDKRGPVSQADAFRDLRQQQGACVGDEVSPSGVTSTLQPLFYASPSR